MKKVLVIDLVNVQYNQMNEKINEELGRLQNDGKSIVDFRVMGSALNKCAVFILYDE